MKAPTHHNNLAEHVRVLANVINENADGRTDNFGSITLTENQTTTTVNDRRIGQDSGVALTPQTANAAAALTNTYVSSKDPRAGTFTLTHNNEASTDRTFVYIITG